MAVDGGMELPDVPVLVADPLVTFVQVPLVVAAPVEVGPGEGLMAGRAAVSALVVLTKGAGHGVM